jgi:hypothetical protein
MNDPQGRDAQLRWALRQAALRQVQMKRLEGGTVGEAQANGLILPPGPRAQASPEHYHLVYNVPKENLSIPHFAIAYVTAREAYQRMYSLGMEAAPNSEFYDDGQVGIETRLHGRADLWWIVLEVAACIKSQCLNLISREQRKRSLVLLPDEVPD